MAPSDQYVDFKDWEVLNLANGDSVIPTYVKGHVFFRNASEPKPTQYRDPFNPGNIWVHRPPPKPEVKKKVEPVMPTPEEVDEWVKVQKVIWKERATVEFEKQKEKLREVEFKYFRGHVEQDLKLQRETDLSSKRDFLRQRKLAYKSMRQEAQDMLDDLQKRKDAETQKVKEKVRKAKPKPHQVQPTEPPKEFQRATDLMRRGENASKWCNLMSKFHLRPEEIEYQLKENPDLGEQLMEVHFASNPWA